MKRTGTPCSTALLLGILATPPVNADPTLVPMVMARAQVSSSLASGTVGILTRMAPLPPVEEISPTSTTLRPMQAHQESPAEPAMATTLQPMQPRPESTIKVASTPMRLVRMAPALPVAEPAPPAELVAMNPPAPSAPVQTAVLKPMVPLATREKTTEPIIATLRPMEAHAPVVTAATSVPQLVRMADSQATGRSGRNLAWQKDEQPILVPMQPRVIASAPAEGGKLTRMADLPSTAVAGRTQPGGLPTSQALRTLRLGQTPLSPQAQRLEDAAAMAAAQETLSLSPEEVARQVSQIDPDNELFLEFDVDGQMKMELLRAHKGRNDKEVYLPFSIMMQALGFPIQTNGGLASGWFMEEKRTFILDAKGGYVEIAGERTPLPAGSVYQDGGELYVSSRAFEEWFPVRLKLDMDDLKLTARSTEVLPEAARLARQELWERYGTNTGLPDGPHHQLTRAMWGWPGIRLDMGSSFASNAAGNTLENNLGIQAEGAMLGMDSYIGLNFSKDANGVGKLAGGSFRLSRDSISGTTLGFLGANHLELGDVNLPRLSLINNASQGQGIAFSNRPNGFAGNLNQIELKGEGPVGWDVEVYQDDGLLAFGRVGPDGRYSFTQLDLGPGENNFRIVLYGPQGERQERRQSYYLGEGMLKPGAWVYDVGLTRSADPLINPDTDDEKRPGTMAVNSYLGLTRSLSLNVGAAKGPLGSDKSDHSAATIGLRAGVGRTFGQANVAAFDDGGIGLSFRERYRLGKDMNLGTFYTQLASTTLAPYQPIATRGVEWGDTLMIAGVPFRYGLTLTDEAYDNKPNEQRLTTNQSWRIGKVAFSNNIGRRYTADGQTWEGGDLGFSTFVKGLPLRGQVLYQLGKDDWLNSTMLSTQVKVDDKSTLNLQGQYQPTSGLASVDANIQRDLGPVALGLQGNWQNDNSYQIGVNLGVQMMPEGNKASWQFTSPRGEGLGYGSADLLVFVDENGDGQRNEGEELLPDVRIRNIRSGRETTTDAGGVAHINDLLPNTETIVEVEEGSLPDIYLRPGSTWHVLLANRGYGGKVALPIYRYGEIAGELVHSATPTDFYRTEVWLTDENGKIVKATHAEEDGTFYFESVRLGTYTLHAKEGEKTTNTPVNLTRGEPASVDIRLSF